MKETTCCFTGHRQIPVSKLPEVEKRLTDEIIGLIDCGYTEFVAGGAIGFDALAASTVLTLKTRFPNISLHLVLPCEEQDKYWTAEQKAEYARHLEQADSYEYVCKSYTRYCMHQRNRKMVDISSCIIAFYDGGDKGGTASTVKYANQKKLRTINIY